MYNILRVSLFISKKQFVFLTFRLTQLIRAQRPRRFSETNFFTGKKVVFFFVEPGRNNSTPPLICGLLFIQIQRYYVVLYIHYTGIVSGIQSC
jgi:hypothetical protein